MARVSTKENKNIYQLTREGLKLSRDAASELLESIPPERIEKIENERSLPHPDEVLAMSDKYKQPSLCNYYCANQCPIGQEYVPEIKVKDLSQIVLEMLASLNSMGKQKDRLIEITADGEISMNWRISSSFRRSWSGSPSPWKRCSCGRSGCWLPASLMKNSTTLISRNVWRGAPEFRVFLPHSENRMPYFAETVIYSQAVMSYNRAIIGNSN